MTMRKHILVALFALLATLVVVPSAQAGRVASDLSISTAIQSGSSGAIIAALEEAEFLPCGACIPKVKALLDDQDYAVREVAAWWFSARPAQMQEIHDMSVARLYGSDLTQARNAADALGTFRHPRAITALIYAAGRADLDAAPPAAALPPPPTL